MSKFTSYYKKYKFLFAIDIIASFLSSAILLIFPYVTKLFIDDYIPNKNLDKMIFSGVFLAILLIVRLFLTYIIQYYGHVMGTKIEKDMRQDLFAKIETLDYSYFAETKTGTIMSYLVNNLRDVSEMAHHVPEEIFRSVIMIVGAFVILFTINVEFSLILLGLILLVIVYSIFTRDKMSKAFVATRKTHGELNSKIESSVGGVRLTKAYVNEDYEINKFSAVNREFQESWAYAYKRMGIFFAGNHFLIDLSKLILLCYGGYCIYNGTLTFGEFLAFYLYVEFLLMPIRSILMIINQIQKGFSGVRKFNEIMSIKPSISPQSGGIEVSSFNGDIVFDNVSFRYDDDEEHVLSNFSLEIKGGEKIAIVGETGVGKSTLSKLVPRFYDVNSGEIKIDGNNVKEYNVSNLRNLIGHVQQDIYIFYGTFKDNIKYGKPNATDSEIIEAAKKANIHDFIISLDKGYDSIVGERGIKLSGGQKQRLSISRVFLKSPDILILDEATSSLDNVTEKQIQESLDKLAVNKTTIVIAHRLTTIMNSDRIVVLGKEGIEEIGTHKELLNNKGHYRKLYDSVKENSF